MYIWYDLLHPSKNVLNQNVGSLSIPSFLRKLYECDIRSVMVEGGASVINTFLNQASQPRGPGESPVVDTLIVTVAPTLVGDDGLGYTAGISGDILSVSNHVFLWMPTDLSIRSPSSCTRGQS